MDNLEAPEELTDQRSSGRVFLGVEDLYNLQENVYRILRSTPGKLSEHLRKNEKVFSRAWKNMDLVYFWQYLENYFWYRGIYNEIPKNAAELLLKNKHRLIEQLVINIGLLFHWWPLRYHEQDVGLSKEECMQLYEKLSKNRERVDWEEYRDRIKKPFLIYVISLLENLEAETSNQDWLTFFENVMIELKDLRNAEIHAGKGNPYSQISLQSNVPGFVSNLRWHLVYQCRDS